MTNIQPISIDDLWRSLPICDRRFSPDLLTDLPAVARRYLKAAIAPGTPLASAVRLWMHGNIKLGQKWHYFKGEEVICWNRGMIWRATTWMQGLPIWGADQVVDGVSSVQWKMLGLFPVMQAGGEDVTRSGVGRMQGEGVWLPSVFCNSDISWTDLDVSRVQANFTALGEPAHLTFTVSDLGILERVKFERWGNPEGKEYHYENFGVMAQESGTFEGYTIPTRIRAGWYFGSDRFESEGEFFRCTIDKAIYR
ncbi:DUF6544 family protein [Halotia wernerae UHCC 0503]|nr:DUF6544 family protein [Halotia wernerae UHCC 0503]